MASLFAVVALVLVAVGVVAVVSARRGGGAVDAVSVRRFFQYLLLGILFVVVAIGVAGLLARGLGDVPEGWQDASTLLARALAFTIVGLPLAALLSWLTLRSFRSDPAEAESGILTLYLSLMLMISLIGACLGLQTTLFQALGRASFDAEAMGQFLAWGALWALHWVAARRFLDGDRASIHLLLGSLVGLVGMGGGLVATLGNALKLLLFKTVILGSTSMLAQSGVILLVGGLVWVWYWLGSTARRPRSTAWLAYVLLAGVGGGLVVALVGATMMIWRVLVWILGDRLGSSASAHFDPVTVEVAMVLVGAVLWWYHRALLAGQKDNRDEVSRVYEYLISGIALAGMAAGVGTVIAGFIEALTPGPDGGMTTRNTLLAAATLLLVGTPVWWMHWRRIARARRVDDVGEVSSLTRRTYLIVSFGVAGLAAVVALLTAGSTLLQDVVTGQVGAATLRAIRYSLGVLAAGAAVSAYHGAIFTQDRTVARTSAAQGPRSVVLVGPADGTIVATLRRFTGGHVELWERGGEDVGNWDPEAVLEALAGHSGDDVVVIAEAGKPTLIPVDRRRS